MAKLLEIINNWFATIGLKTDWTVTWDGLLSFCTAIVSIVFFTAEKILTAGSNDGSNNKAKFEREHQQKEIRERQSAVFYNGEVSIFFRELQKNYSETVSGVIKYAKKDGKYAEDSFYIELNPIISSRSHSYQGLNDYEVELLGITPATELQKATATFSVIKISGRIRAFAKFKKHIIKISIGLLIYAFLATRFGDTIPIGNISFSTLLASFLVYLYMLLF